MATYTPVYLNSSTISNTKQTVNKQGAVVIYTSSSSSSSPPSSSTTTRRRLRWKW